MRRFDATRLPGGRAPRRGSDAGTVGRRAVAAIAAAMFAHCLRFLSQPLPGYRSLRQMQIAIPVFARGAAARSLRAARRFPGTRGSRRWYRAALLAPLQPYSTAGLRRLAAHAIDRPAYPARAAAKVLKIEIGSI